MLEGGSGDVGLVASREIKERVRGRIFRIGTLVILVVVAAAIIIPNPSQAAGAPPPRRWESSAACHPKTEQLVRAAASQNQDKVKLVRALPRRGEGRPAVGQARFRHRRRQTRSCSTSPQARQAPPPIRPCPGRGRIPRRAEGVPGRRAHARPGGAGGPAPSRSRFRASSRARSSSTKTTSVIGLVLLFFMLTQYNTWILIGVMQEKSSRVVEVLLATVRPIQLLGGKVLGIGLVALGQAALIVGFALVVAAAVGSDLLHGTAPLVLVCELLWLVLGYAFYCWVYAAAGSTAERQDQVQTLAIPLSIPILLGYIFSITVASSGNPDLFFKILAYLPPTAPFCMPVLVALNQVTWWEFLASVLITIAGTAGMAIFAARIYRRAVLQTGGPGADPRALRSRAASRHATTEPGLERRRGVDLRRCGRDPVWRCSSISAR